MRISAPLLTVVGTVAGTAAAVVAYQTVSAAGSPATTPAASTTSPAPAPVSTTTWLPCGHGWKLKGGACVRIEKKVVVVHDLPAPAAPQATLALSSAGQHASSGRGHDGGHDSSADEQGSDNQTSEQSDDANEPSDDQPGTEDVGGDD